MLDLQDFSIVLAARNHNPTMVNPDFLRGSGVVPGEWELARPPLVSSQASQIIFKNGIQIAAQAGTISFFQGINSQDIKDIELPSIAHRYAAMLPFLEYQGVGINPRRFVTFANQPHAAHKFITQTILSRGLWQDIGTAPMQAGVKLVYTLQGRQLRLDINEVQLQLAEREAIPAVLFVGNFHYELAGESGEERVRNLQQGIENWQVDLATFQDIIENKFLVNCKNESLVLFPQAI